MKKTTPVLWQPIEGQDFGCTEEALVYCPNGTITLAWYSPHGAAWYDSFLDDELLMPQPTHFIKMEWLGVPDDQKAA